MEPETPLPPSPVEEIYDQVLRRGRQLRRRRQLLPWVIGMVLLVSSVPLAMNRFSPSESAIVQPASEESPTPVVSPVESSAAPTSSSTPQTPEPSTSESEDDDPPHCQDSFDSRCGPFVWDPEPLQNRPLSISITFEPENPVVGDEVIFRVTVRDPDAPGVDWQYVSTGAHITEQNPSKGECSDGYGPWTPPNPQAGEETFTFRERYERARAYVFKIRAGSTTEDPRRSSEDRSRCQDTDGPYRDIATATADIVVSEAGASPSPSPSPTGLPT